MIKTVLFDLDGTLLPMDQDVFTKAYFKNLAASLSPHFEPKALIAAIMSGMDAMVRNDGKVNNETVFWRRFREIFGDKADGSKRHFEEFYNTSFDNSASACGFNALAGKIVHRLRDEKFTVALATNPIFPAMATEKRIRWAGLEPSDFELYTTYENIGFCKPNLDYYREILSRLNAKPEETLMVGNDVGEDMVASRLGMSVFLITDCMINRTGEDISAYPHGTFSDLSAYLFN